MGDARRCRSRQDRAPDETEKPAKPEPPAKLASLIAIFGSGARRGEQGRAQLGAADRQRGVPRRRRRRSRYASGAAVEAAPSSWTPAAKRILELNPQHPLIGRLAASVRESARASSSMQLAWLLLDQARIIEGERTPVRRPSRAASLFCCNAASLRRLDQSAAHLVRMRPSGLPGARNRRRGWPCRARPAKAAR